MEAKRCRCGNAESKYSWKAYVAMISLQFGYAGMTLITKVSLQHQPDVSHFVLVVYRQAFATLLLTPLALFFERKARPTITFPIFMHMFVLGLLGPVMEQNLYYAGLKLASPTFSCAVTNLLPAITFITALLFRMEKTGKTWKAKVGGAILTVAGALLTISLLFGNGHSLVSILLLLGSTLTCASFFILLAVTVSKYSAPLTLTAVVCGVGTLQSTALALVMEPNPSVWNIGFGINLFAAAYAGLVTSGIGYYVQGVVVEMAGPVFVSSFNPLVTIIVAIMSSFVLTSYNFYLGGIMGVTLMMIGVCSLLWGKHKDILSCKEEDEGNQDTIKEVIKVISQSCSLPTIFEDDDVEANVPVGVKIETPATVESEKDLQTRVVIVQIECRNLAHGGTK
ncbi:hypothetical protein V2J09_018450 [Rumex salicifolius]